MAVKTNPNTIGDISKEGIEVMERALESFRNGDYTDAEQLREKANQLFDHLSEELGKEDNELNSLYGESRNFGVIYHTFEHNIQEMMKTSTGKKLLAEAVKMIRSDKNLKGQFDVYQSLTNPQGSTGHPELYVEAVMKMMPTSTAKDITESNDRLIKALRQSDILDEYIDIDDKTMECYEAVEKLITTKPTPETVGEIVEAKSKLLEYMSSIPAEKFGVEGRKLDDIMEEISNRTDVPNASEYKLYKEIMMSDDKKALFENYQKETLESIEKVMSESSENAAAWQSTYDSIRKCRFDKANPVVSIAKLVEIKEIVEGDSLKD